MKLAILIPMTDTATADAEALAHDAPRRLLGEPGWTTLEQIATMTRGGTIWSRTAQRDRVNPRTAQETK